MDALAKIDGICPPTGVRAGPGAYRDAQDPG